MSIATINPATGVTEQTFEEISDEEVERILALAAATFRAYRTTTFAQRSTWMVRAAEILEDEVDRIATMMTTEMGKTLAAAKAEVLKCAKTCRYMAERSESFLADEPADAGAIGAESASARWFPLGPVLAVMPWNFPLWQAMRFAAPRPHGRQRRPPQACLERSPDRPLHAGVVRPGRVPRGCVPDHADQRVTGRGGHP